MNGYHDPSAKRRSVFAKVKDMSDYKGDSKEVSYTDTDMASISTKKLLNTPYHNYDLSV